MARRWSREWGNFWEETAVPRLVGRGQGAFMVQTWAQMRSGNCEDIQRQSSWKSDVKGKTSEWRGGRGHPGADSLMWFTFGNKPLWFLSFLSFLGQSYRFHCREPHAGFLCCALSTQPYFIYMILTQEQIPSSSGKTYALCPFSYKPLCSPDAPPRHATGIGI